MTEPRYPVYVISKGRADCCLTARFLLDDGCPFHIVIEPQEREEYEQHFDSGLLLDLPFSDLGRGSIPARNWVWEHAKGHGAARHWILDDNINCIKRRFKARRIPCEAGAALYQCEEFVDRYTNIAVAGLNYCMFLPTHSRFRAFFQNVHVYSCLLIQNDLAHRWRGRYNEDTDLCLQVLAAGLCTVLFNAFSIKKVETGIMKGGNATELYKGDGRLVMARSLERVWPGVVETKRRYGRPQHVINWKKFDTPLNRRDDIDWDAIEQAAPRMSLTRKGTVKSAVVRRIKREHDRQNGIHLGKKA